MIKRNDTKIIADVHEFFEYRKGSEAFGELVSSIMMWLRNYVTDSEIRTVKSDINTFLKETHIDLDVLNEYLSRQDELKLADFSIELNDNEIIISNINTKQKMHWENKKGE